MTEFHLFGQPEMKIALRNRTLESTTKIALGNRPRLLDQPIFCCFCAAKLIDDVINHGHYCPILVLQFSRSSACLQIRQL